MLELIVSLSFIKAYLGIDSDNTKYDDQIVALMPLFAETLEEYLGITSADEITNVIKECYCAKFGCHLRRVNGFGRDINYYKAGDIEKRYESSSDDTGDWCSVYNDLLSDATGENLLIGSASRKGMSDEYSEYY